MKEPQLFNLDLCKVWSADSIFALAVGLGFDYKAASIAFLATVPEGDYQQYLLTKPGPTYRGGPNVKLVIKTVAELTAIAEKAAKEGKPVEKIYPHFMRDVQRRFKQGPGTTR